MMLKLIRLELARTDGFPEGSAKCGYEFVAPLTADGHIDDDGWRKFRSICTVLRFWSDEDDEHGRLERTPDGGWVFSYAGGGDGDNEPIFRFAAHAFIVGEYLSITEHDGETRPFRIAQVSVPTAVGI